MGKLFLITGGAKSGKSKFAEDQLIDKKNVCYIATGTVQFNDPEWQERIFIHQQRRPQSWYTHEQYSGLSNWLNRQNFKYYLLDCVTMLTTNILFDYVSEYYPQKLKMSDDNFLNSIEKAHLSSMIQKEWDLILDSIRDSKSDFYIVTNEIGLGLVPENALGRFFRDILGRINQLLAEEASEVYMIVSGLSLRLK